MNFLKFLTFDKYSFIEVITIATVTQLLIAGDYVGGFITSVVGLTMQTVMKHYTRVLYPNSGNSQ